MIVLPNRMKKIAEMASSYHKVADIGTDHGLIPNYLADNHPSMKFIATDISQKCLDKSIRTSNLYGHKDRIEHRVGNGLNPIHKNEVDCIIIAGMGGCLISKILEDNKSKAKNSTVLLLQPMNASELLRQELSRMNFDIVGEELVKEENRVYEILMVNPNKAWNTTLYIHGKVSNHILSPRHELLDDFVSWKLQELYSIKAELTPVRSHRAEVKLKEVEDEIEQWVSLKHDG